MRMEDYFFNPGDLVTIRQDLPDKPVMMVVRKKVATFKNEEERRNDRKPVLLGIQCRWFSTDRRMQEAVFSTKDLIPYE